MEYFVEHIEVYNLEYYKSKVAKLTHKVNNIFYYKLSYNLIYRSFNIKILKLFLANKKRRYKVWFMVKYSFICVRNMKMKYYAELNVEKTLPTNFILKLKYFKYV